MPLSAGDRFGPHRIVGPLGAGGMGEVYRAVDTRLNREVALKVLPAAMADDAQYLARFEREAQTLAALNHPNIAAVYGVEQGALVMELVPGPTLGERLERGPLAWPDAEPIVRQMIEALEAAHERGVVHRDLKPANVKITPDGAVKLLDFGLAKAGHDSAEAGVSNSISPTMSLAMTQAGFILGTAHYMAPEQAVGKPVDKRADIWSFGVVLFEMLTGKRLFAGETVGEILASVIKDPVEWTLLPPETPANVRKLLRRCLERDRKRRLRDIGEARVLLDEEATPAAVSSAAVSRSSKLPWIAAAILGVAAAALAFLHFRETPPVERVLRYTLDLPRDAAVHSFALSPDGRMLAIALLQEGRSRIWLRSLESLTAAPVAGTEDASYPFWSPDSRTIAFFTTTALKRVDIDGAAPTQICVVSDGRGGTWNADGTIVLASNTAGIMTVPETGGIPARVLAKVEGQVQRYPVFLEDGRRFLFLVNLAGEKSGLYWSSLDGQPPQRVEDVNSSISWSPAPGRSNEGVLLYARDGALVARRFDGRTLKPIGGPFPVASGVAIGPHLQHAQATASGNGILVYDGGSSMDRMLVWRDRSGKLLQNIATTGAWVELQLSPDGRTAAVGRLPLSGSAPDIWLADTVRGAETRMTLSGNNRYPVWSPDGKRLAWAVFAGRERVASIVVREAGGTGAEEVLFQSKGWTAEPSDWSPDGRYLLVTGFEPKVATNRDIFVLDVAKPGASSGKPEPFAATPFNETQAQFSPDGRWIAYASDESSRHEIYVRPFPAAAGKWKVSLQGGQMPRWRRDGKELFYVGPEGRLMAVPVRAGPGGFDPGEPTALFQSNAIVRTAVLSDFRYAVSPDGQRFLMAMRANDGETAVLTVVQNWLAAKAR